jgi:glutamyl-tRNA reductase
MQLFAFGVNHQTAPLTVRERIAFNTEGLPVALRDLVDREPVREAAEQAVRDIPGVQSALVALTAERAAGPQTAKSIFECLLKTECFDRDIRSTVSCTIVSKARDKKERKQLEKIDKGLAVLKSNHEEPKNTK